MKVYRDQDRWQEEAAELAKAAGEDPGMYIGRPVLNWVSLQHWWETANPMGQAPALDPFPHVTVVYSKASFPWERDTAVMEVQTRPQLEVLGKDGALVVRFDSPMLGDRWAAAKQAGAAVSYDSYKGHATLFYLGAGVTEWTPPVTFYAPPALVLGPEIVGPRGVNVFEAAQAPKWYQDARGVQS